MSETATEAAVPVVSLTDEELLALSSLTGRTWPRPLRALFGGADPAQQAASGLRSLRARGLLEPELPERAAALMGAVLAVVAEAPPSLTVAVTDTHFVIDVKSPVMEALLLPDAPLATYSSTVGIHTFRTASVREIVDSFGAWVDEWSSSPPAGTLQVTAFVRDGRGAGVAGAVLAPRAAMLHEVEADRWEPVAIPTPASPRDLLAELVRRVQSAPPA